MSVLRAPHVDGLAAALDVVSSARPEPRPEVPEGHLGDVAGWAGT